MLQISLKLFPSPSQSGRELFVYEQQTMIVRLEVLTAMVMKSTLSFGT
jgi:hypothetical protein